MKQVLSVLLIFCALFALISCSLKHEHKFGEWVVTKYPNCTESGTKERVCSCGEKETLVIEPTAHNWRQATCTTPKTCIVCAKTEGSALGHLWEEATCASPKKCKRCGITEGIKLTTHSVRQGYCRVCGNFIDELHDQAKVFTTCTNNMSSANVSANFAYQRGDLATAVKYLNTFSDNISEMFKMYSNYPTDFRDMYSVINDLYNSYVDFANNFNSKTTNSEKLKCVKAMIQTYIDWKKNVFTPVWETIWKYE